MNIVEHFERAISWEPLLPANSGSPVDRNDFSEAAVQLRGGTFTKYL